MPSFFSGLRAISPRSVNLSTARRFVTSTWAIVVGLFVLSVCVRLGELDAMVNSDMYFLWSARTARFMSALRTGNLAETFQSHHPGVTLMWILGATWQVTGLLGTPMQLHPEKVIVAVVPILVFGSLFVASSYPILVRLLGDSRRFAVLVASLLLATEPLLVAHARNPHLDTLANGFAWLAVYCGLLAKREGSLPWACGSGVLLGLGVMSKISTAGLAFGLVAVFVIHWLRNPASLRPQFPLLATIGIAALVTVVAIWPALWVNPVGTLMRHHRGLTHEVGKAVPFMLFGKAGVQAVPWWVYGIFVVFLVTPEFWIPGVLMSPLLLRAESQVRRVVAELCIVMAPLLFFLFRSNNVGVRNTLLFMPLLALLSALAFDYARSWLQRQSALWLRFAPHAIVFASLLVRLDRLAGLYPLPITYCSRWTTLECSEVFHQGWGEGMKEASSFVDGYSKSRHNSTEPLRIFGSGYAPVMGTWTDIAVARRLEEAELLIDYLAEWQRERPRSLAIAAYAKERALSPIHVVRIQGRDYVRIYEGPVRGPAVPADP